MRTFSRSSTAVRLLGIAKTDVQVSFWAQWLLGAAATAGCGLGVYIGVALWAVFRRSGRGSSPGVWSAPSGGVLLDGQAVALRIVQRGNTCI